MGFCAGHNTASLPLCCGRWHPGMTLVPLTHPTGHPLFRVCRNCVVFLFSFLLTTTKLMKPTEIASNERKVHQTTIQHRVALSLSFHTQLVPNSPRNQRLSPCQSPGPPSTAQPCFPQPTLGSAPSRPPFRPLFCPPVLSNQVGSLSQVSKYPRYEADSWQRTFLTSRLSQAGASHRNESSMARWRVVPAARLRAMLLPGSAGDLGNVQHPTGAQTIHGGPREEIEESFGAQKGKALWLSSSPAVAVAMHQD